MTQLITIKNLKRGEIASVAGYSADAGQMEQELREIGFAEGDEVEVLAIGLIGGTPISVRLNRTIIALRANEAALIEVERRS